MENEKINELDKKVDDLVKHIAVMNNNVEKQGNTIEKLLQAFEKLSVLIEKTNENDKKIDTLFRKVEYVEMHGTKHCPVNESRLKTVEEKIDKMSNYAIGAMIAVLIQFVSLIVFIIDKHIK